MEDNATLLKLKGVVNRLTPANWPTDCGSQNKAVNLMGLLGGSGLFINLYTPVYF